MRAPCDLHAKLFELNSNRADKRSNELDRAHVARIRYARFVICVCVCMCGRAVNVCVQATLTGDCVHAKYIAIIGLDVAACISPPQNVHTLTPSRSNHAIAIGPARSGPSTGHQHHRRCTLLCCARLPLSGVALVVLPGVCR